MRVALWIMMLTSLASAEVLAQACDVRARSSSDAVKLVEQHTCYTYSKLPEEAINWSCSNESKDMVSTQKQKVARCAEGSVGSCIAPLTQEALANPKAGGGQPSTRPTLPKDARVVTYYYDTPSLGQARADCERNEGIWQTH